ncbi:MAG TPA: VOC family protein [Verrucomicrobiae bacterium]|nr:VOC family protein [Verrucomicrobiae bacterium]
MKNMLRITLIVTVLLMAVWMHAAEDAGRPKIYGIAYVKVKVTDVEKSKAFYGEALGLRAGGDSCKGVANPCFSINGSQHIELLKTDVGDKGSFLPEIGLATNSLEQMAGYLTAKGIPTSEILRRPDGMKYLEVLDPERHKIVFVEGKPSTTEALPPGAISNRMIHAGFVVKDGKAESRFYEDILGFKVFWHGGFKEDETNWYMVQVPDGDNWLEYMLNIPEAADHKELGIQNHFSLGVRDIHATAKDLEAKGVKLPGKLILGRDGKWQLTLLDPDETRAEVMDFVPVEKPCCSEYTGTQPKP